MSDRNKAGLLLAVPVILALAGIRYYQVIDEPRWILLSAGLTAALGAALAASPSFRAFADLGLTPESPLRRPGLGPLVIRVVLIAVIYGLPVFIGFTGAVPIANGLLDRGEEVCRDADLVMKGTGAKGLAQMTVSSWRPGRTEEVIHISGRFSSELRRGAKVSVCTRPGALGIEWLTGYGHAR